MCGWSVLVNIEENIYTFVYDTWDDAGTITGELNIFPTYDEVIPNWLKKRISNPGEYFYTTGNRRNNVIASGIPFIAMWCELDIFNEFQWSIPDNTSEYQVRGGIKFQYNITINQLEYRALPLRILPVGFLLNTLTWAGAWLIILIPTWRPVRRLRIARGHCVYCNYDISHADHACCLECGRVFEKPAPYIIEINTAESKHEQHT